MPLAAQTPEQRALNYLAVEVQRWRPENGCFSCHNNGDAARALYDAAARGYPIPAAALAETTPWLERPAGWDKDHADPAFSDKKLAHIQFAAALAVGVATGASKDRAALAEAAASLLPYQESDGSWQVGTGGAVGSPVTYGAGIATWLARQTLEQSASPRFAEALARADEWLRNLKPDNIPDAAAALLARPSPKMLAFLLAAQASDGGWGPRRHTPAEPFDTAVALLALTRAGDTAETRPAIARGREFLVHSQLPDGGWPETTRPPGGQSYAHHISTTGWATLALLATNPER